jgi:lipid A oxidase
MASLVKALCIAPALVLMLYSAAAAEFSIMIYFGKVLTNNGEVRLTSGATDLTFHDVRWKDKSFNAPIYYGIRAGYWLDRSPEWGVAVDFAHAKTILHEEDVVPVTGYREGARVEGREAIDRTIRNFELSHGLNMLTFNGLHRWFPVGSGDGSRSGSLQCYTGLGAGFSIPHVEARLKDDGTGKEKWTGRYQFAGGPVVNGMAGVKYDFADPLSGFLEYKLSYADVRADLSGGEIDTASLNHQFISGLGGNVR